MMKPKRKEYGQTYYAIFKGEIIYYCETETATDAQQYESGNYFETATEHTRRCNYYAPPKINYVAPNAHDTLTARVRLPIQINSRVRN